MTVESPRKSVNPEGKRGSIGLQNMVRVDLDEHVHRIASEFAMLASLLLQRFGPRAERVAISILSCVSISPSDIVGEARDGLTHSSPILILDDGRTSLPLPDAWMYNTYYSKLKNYSHSLYATTHFFPRGS